MIALVVLTTPPAGAALPSVPAGCGGGTHTFTNNTVQPIPDNNPTGVASSIAVSGAKRVLLDVDVRIDVRHTYSSDLDITLTSPAGTTVVLSTRNGSSHDNVFAGTLFDDQAPIPVTEHVFSNGVAATRLAPEGALARLAEENPNGTWTLKVVDGTSGDLGTRHSWELRLRTADVRPTTTRTQRFPTGPPNVAIPDGGSVSSAIVTDETLPAGTIRRIQLVTSIQHTFANDLDVTLTSPAGTTLVMTTDNGGANDNVFSGSTFTDTAAVPVTDYPFTNGNPATPVAPEAPLAGFLGENPRGAWTLTVADDEPGDVGTLTTWWLEIDVTSGCTAPKLPLSCWGAATTTVSAAGLPLGIPDSGTLSRQISVSGAGRWLLDADLTLNMPHTRPADLDVTLTSPAGTTVVLTTDSGASEDNVFAPVTFDDDAPTPVTDAFHKTGLTTLAVAPEGAFGRFRGENPNGIWTVTIADDAAEDAGTLRGATLRVHTLPTAPQTVAKTKSVSVPTSITDHRTIRQQVKIKGAPPYLVGAELATSITHTFSSDLFITLTSPAGTTVVVSTGNGGSQDNVFDGTTWTDAAATPATDHVYADLVTATPLAPEGAFGAFVGENPNGTWTLAVRDNAGGDIGSLNGWSLTTRSGQKTKLKLGGSDRTVARGTTVNLPGTLTVAGAGTPVPDRRVVLQQRRLGTTAWSEVTGAKTSATGKVAFAHAPTRNTEYRLKHAANACYTASTSNIRTIRVS